MFEINYDARKLLPIGKNKKVIGLMKDELGSRIMKEVIALRPEIYNGHVDKKAKGTDKHVIRRETKIQD